MWEQGRYQVRASERRRGKHRQQTAAIQALLTQPTIELAARTSGISPTTLYRYMQLEEFQAAYKDAKQRMLDGAINKLRNASSGAVDVLEAIAHDLASPQSSRVAAAKAILQLAIEAGAIEDLNERLSELESRTAPTIDAAIGERPDEEFESDQTAHREVEGLQNRLGSDSDNAQWGTPSNWQTRLPEKFQ